MHRPIAGNASAICTSAAATVLFTSTTAIQEPGSESRAVKVLSALREAVVMHVLANWNPDQWGKFFGYLTDNIGKLVTTCVIPILTFYAGKFSGKSEVHGQQIDDLSQQVVALATNAPPPTVPPPGTTTTTTTTATTKPINPALVDTLPLPTGAPKPAVPQPKAPTP